jgi:hypothetical protein
MAAAAVGSETPFRRSSPTAAKEPFMTLTELKGKYARLSVEIEALAGAGAHSEAKLARLTHELEEIDREFVAFRRRAETAPTLRDVVSWTELRPRHQNHFEQRASAR